jgi:hypothetical protein
MLSHSTVWLNKPIRVVNGNIARLQELSMLLQVRSVLPLFLGEMEYVSFVSKGMWMDGGAKSTLFC